MNVTKKVALAAAAVAVLGAMVARLPISGWSRPTAIEPMALRGAIVQQDADPGKQLPIADVTVAADGDVATSGANSDGSGFFSLALRPEIKAGTPIVLKF